MKKVTRMIIEDKDSNKEKEDEKSKMKMVGITHVPVENHI